MITKACYTEDPAAIRFENLPGKKNHVWMRRNIVEQDAPQMDGEAATKTPVKQWVADEVYFETASSYEDIKADEDKWYAYGTTWVDGAAEPDVLTNKQLTDTCGELQTQQLDLYDAVATIYESLGV